MTYDYVVSVICFCRLLEFLVTEKCEAKSDLHLL